MTAFALMAEKLLCLWPSKPSQMNPSFCSMVCYHGRGKCQIQLCWAFDLSSWHSLKSPRKGLRGSCWVMGMAVEVAVTVSTNVGRQSLLKGSGTISWECGSGFKSKYGRGPR